MAATASGFDPERIGGKAVRAVEAELTAAKIKLSEVAEREQEVETRLARARTADANLRTEKEALARDRRAFEAAKIRQVTEAVRASIRAAIRVLSGVLGGSARPGCGK
ncbi:hypothetical protein EKE94_05500 [Mesobaculum littorinae]|uniref:Uncharacterized protein n=1 Tax=Mesobaculum littorinae TaxID=2486419 RepID=A0A438AI42_9RHOB|nr:hypothetical protein [Mesobaculum littorinae]RVV98379.1 hypothetical protein EKE94_05500 [Mesobaculum littorinae]